MLYEVTVKVIAEVEYTVTVDSSSEWKAEDAAIDRWRANLPSDFDVEKGYITSFETDNVKQLTFECCECGVEISEQTSQSHDELCESCYATL